MFELWVPITILAAFMQNARSALQKHLKGQLNTSGATFARFGYGFPFAILYLMGLHYFAGLALPQPNGVFLFYSAVGGVAQIVATALLVYLFSLRNFAVGTAYSKTETVQAAIFGLIVLGDTITTEAALAIMISLVGVIAISVARSYTGTATLFRSLFGRPALIGLASGAAFGGSAVAYRAASLSLGGEGFLIQAAYTLAVVTVLQTLLMAVYMRFREPGELTRALRAWRIAGLVGLCGAIGSAGWFTAMTIQKVAYVRALGQIELIFTFAASYFIFKEKSNRTEVIGILLIVAGIILLLTAA